MAIYRRIPGGPHGPNRYLFEGGSGDDTLIGTWQDEILIGKAGRDLLIGGAGVDYFMIDSPLEMDHIKDFEADEKILISPSAFGLSGNFSTNYARFSLDTQARTLSFDGQLIAKYDVGSTPPTSMTLQNTVMFVDELSALTSGSGGELM
ncbi:MAG: hypothetical protein AAF289_14655 [Cyanobacteria bacterium P01_A01_bin.135]